MTRYNGRRSPACADAVTRHRPAIIIPNSTAQTITTSITTGQHDHRSPTTDLLSSQHNEQTTTRTYKTSPRSRHEGRLKHQQEQPAITITTYPGHGDETPANHHNSKCMDATPRHRPAEHTSSLIDGEGGETKSSQRLTGPNEGGHGAPATAEDDGK